MRVVDVEGTIAPTVLSPDTPAGAESKATGRVRLPTGRKVGYGAGQMIEMIVESTLNIFILFYATAVCGLPGALAGLAIGAGVIIDAIASPLIGSLSDGWRSRFGQRVPFMAVSLVPIVLIFNLMFSLPTGLGEMGLFIWLTFLSVLLRVSLSLFTVPYQALGAELTEDYEERSSVAAWRWGIGILGTMAVIGLGYGVFLAGEGGTSRREAYLPLTLTLSGLLLAAALVAIRQGLAVRKARTASEGPREAVHLRLLGEVGEVLRNRTFRILFVAGLLFNIEAGVHQALGLHVATYFWKLAPSQIQILGMVAVLGLIVAAPLAGPVIRRVEKRTMLIFGIVGLAMAHTTPATLKLLGLLPFTGDALMVFLTLMSLLNGAMLAIATIAFLSIMPDAADEHEHQFGNKRQALYFAGWSFATKAATGVGVLIAGMVLQLVQFPKGVSEQTATIAVPDQMANLLALAQGPGVGVLPLIAALLVLLYRIDKRTHARIIDDLVMRRTKNQT